jgi:3-oxoacyl-[acyl-carrier-protein] synthase II
MMNAFSSKQNQAWITDVAAVTALGDHIDETWGQLLHARTAIRPVDRFDVEGYTSGVAACIDDLRPRGHGSMVHSLLSRLARGLGPVPEDALLVTATAKAGIDMLEKYKRGNPYHAEDMFPASFPQLVSETFGLKKQGINISAACASSILAVSQACVWIYSGTAESVLVCSADLVSEFVFSGFSALGALSSTPCRPFDRERSGLSLGEGAVALLLMSAKRAEAEGKAPLGRVCGWGAANDAFHVTAPDPDGIGLTQAIYQSLKHAGLGKEAVCAVSAHGTGTVSNDAMELRALRDCFGNHVGTRLPVFSVKGAIGHTLGAAGGLEIALGLKALSQQVVPPTVGFSSPADGAQGWVSSEAVAIQGDYLLSSNSGFGGINAALVLGKGA